MNQCSFQTALDVWNEGFQGYFVNLTLSLDKFLSRLTAEGIGPEHSFVAFYRDRPAGFVLNAFRESAGRKFAWNGGTGVIPEFRGQGFGKVLIEAAISLYKELKVDVAMLEAISGNASAIALYKHFGYQSVDELTYLQTDEVPTDFLESRSTSYEVNEVFPAAVGELHFYRDLSAWQTQWQSLALKRGEAIIVRDALGKPAGYALFEKRYDDTGKLARIALSQCEVEPSRADADLISSLLLQHVFLREAGEYQRTTMNLRKSNHLIVEMLEHAGFSTFIEQQHMTRAIS